MLSNGLGGAFNPGAEVAWNIRDKNTYSKPYQINANRSFLPNMITSSVGTTPGVNLYERASLSLGDNIKTGMEPGDLTKYSALPWQADFNECSNENVDVTYEAWNVLYDRPDNGADPSSNQKNFLGLWWPSHRPMQVAIPVSGEFVEWASGIQQNTSLNYEGDYKMVTNWNDLGFVKSIVKDGQIQGYYQQERNHDKLGPQLTHTYKAPTKKKSK